VWIVVAVAFATGACGSPSSPSVAGTSATAPNLAPVTAAPSAASCASASATASASTAVKIQLDGQGPIGLDIAGSRAWVIQTDSGGLVEVDLDTQRIARTLDVPAGGSQVVASNGDTVYVGRYTPDPSGRTIAIVDLRSGDVSGLSFEPIGGLGVDRSAIWALQTSGKVSRIDRLSLAPTGSVSVHVDSDAHMDALAGAGSVWVPATGRPSTGSPDQSRESSRTSRPAAASRWRSITASSGAPGRTSCGRSIPGRIGS
jgi:hypothetical protein